MDCYAIAEVFAAREFPIISVPFEGVISGVRFPVAPVFIKTYIVAGQKCHEVRNICNGNRKRLSYSCWPPIHEILASNTLLKGAFSHNSKKSLL